jgi:hypothetical protein
LWFLIARRSSRGAVPRSLASPGSSSRELCLPFRVRPVCHLSDECRSTYRRTPPRVSFPFATEVIGVHCSMSFPRLTLVPSSVFLTLSTACSSNYRVGLFHPTATSGIRTSGGFARCQAGSPHRRVVPSCRSRSSPTSRLPAWRQILPRRLQGFDPSSDPSWMTGGLGLPALDPLLGFQLLWVFVRIPWKRPHVSSAHDLSCCALAVYAAAGLQRINRRSA